MGHNKILSAILAFIALVAFQGDQVSHAIDAYAQADTHIHAAPAHADPHSFAGTSFARSHFEAPGHPWEDLGHSEADCPLANIVDDFDITGISDLSTQTQPTGFATAKNSLIPNEVDINTQIRAPPAYLA